jgi:hypothetical protein
MKEHHDREGNLADDMASTAQRVAEIGRETAAKTASYVQGGVDRAADYAQSLTGVASETITDVTGRPPEEWARHLRQFVGRSPLQALVAAIALGFAVGLILRRD